MDNDPNNANRTLMRGQAILLEQSGRTPLTSDCHWRPKERVVCGDVHIYKSWRIASEAWRMLTRTLVVYEERLKKERKKE